MQEQFNVLFYEDWMKMQIIEMICNHYGYDKGSYIEKFSNFYEDNFQKEAIKVVVLDGKTVAGFMGFFYWPYQFNGKNIRAFQAGNVIVHPNYRGKGVFFKMVSLLNEKYKEKNVELLLGFPVTAAYNTYIRNGWENLFNLQWFVKINSLLSPFLKINNKKLTSLFSEPKRTNLKNYSNQIYLNDSNDFIEWRKQFMRDNIYYYSFSNNNNIIQFGFKINIRKKFIKELIIGEISSSFYDEDLLRLALKDFLKKIKSLHFISIISIAINTEDIILLNTIKKIGFKIIDKKIFFVAKNFTNNTDLQNKSKWSPLRGDLDTW